MTNLTDRIAKLSSQKREILLQKLNQNQAETTFPTIQSQSRDTNTFPLSFSQERLWFLDQLEPDNPFYNQPTALRLTGELKISVLAKSLKEIIRRHEILRTNFTIVEGKPVQIINPSVNFQLQVIDLEDLSTTDRNNEVKNLADLEAEQPFNLERDSLLRVTLLKIGVLEHIVLFTTHHIISDAWSTKILVQEIGKIYQAFATGKPLPLSELKIQYADFTVWQRQWLTEEVLETQLSYWQRQLKNMQLLDLPTDRPRPATLTYVGATLPFTLSKSLTQALKAFSDKEKVTLFMTLLAAFKVLMHRYSHQDDLAVGIPIANRNRAEIEGTIGFFMNTLVLRTKVNGNLNVRELIQQVKNVTLEAYTHQDFPFEQLVNELNPNRNPNRNPLFDIMFTLENVTIPELNLSDLTISSFEQKNLTSKFDLVLGMRETEERLEGSIEYNTDLFDVSTIKRIIGHFQVLLTAIVANPELKLCELPILTEAEQYQLLIEWNNTKTEYSSDKCIQQLFEEQVAKTPDLVAVVFENQQLTYLELNQKANQLAHYLQKLGVQTETKVGILIERSLEMIIGILGILKAGGAYVPIEPNYPEKRLAFVLENSQVAILLSQQHLIEKLQTGEIQCICLDTDWEKIEREKRENPCSQTTSNNLAYIIYTSGSTGKPKGVLIKHSNVIRLFASTQAWFEFSDRDVWTLFHSYAFDFSVWELWGALLHGGRLVVVSYWVSRSPEDFYNLLSTQKVTVLNQTPSAFRQLIKADASLAQKHPLNLRLVIFGGEALELQSLKPWFERHGDRSPQLVNMYGITETTVHVTYRLLSAEDLKLSVASVIGRPIPDLQVYILDDNRQLLPIGVWGEMYVGGAGLAASYLKLPELTAEKFIPHPFSKKLGERLYKTGDLARYLSNGDIDYLGRIDDQVKIRGFRLELGEIEATLAQHLKIEQCVVIPREDSSGKKHLVAYFVSSEKLEFKQLREFCRSKLPDYMIPAAWVALEVLPLTPNGKIDRRALPNYQITPTTETYLAPRTPVEDMLASIWQQVLNVARVSIDDNFFELGGHSLLATQVISQIRHNLSVELPLRRLFELPTVAALAIEIETLWRSPEQLAIPAIKAVARDRAIPLSFAQQRLWFSSRLEPDSPAHNVPEALHLQGKLDIEVLTQTIKTIIQRHETLRTKFQIVAGKPVQAICPIVNFQLPVVDLANLSKALQEQQISNLAKVQALQPFDLEKDCLLRVTLIRLNDLKHIILFTMHHIISDGWSMGVLVREVATLYEAFLKEKPSPLPDLPIQYADYAVWQRDYLQTEILDQQLSYWKQQLADAPPVVNLPIAFPRTEVRTSRGETQTLVISQTLSHELKNLSAKNGVTLFMTLLGAFQTLLHWYTDREDIVVGTDIANRHRSEIENLIGFFVNQLVLRTDFSDNPTFQNLLERVRQITLDAYANQDLPFDKLVEVLNPKRDLSYTPLFQVKIILQNAPMSSLELPDLQLSSLDFNKKIAEYDLLLNIEDTAIGLNCLLKYDTDLFSENKITELLENLELIISTIVRQPDLQLSEIKSILNEFKEQKQVAKQSEYQKTLAQKFNKVRRKSLN